MSSALLDRVLLTNDDGIEAPGLQALEAAARNIAREVWVVAPAQDQSGTSHSLSLHAPLRVSEAGMRRFAVSGTPGDCAAIGIRAIMADHPPTLVLSGINRGANLGTETVFSGTVGAAMTAMLLGLPAIALSQSFTDGQPVRWDTARELAPDAIRRLAAVGWAADCCLNVNFPDCPADRTRGLRVTEQGCGHLDGIEILTRTDPRGLDYHWLKLRRAAQADRPSHEAAALAENHITITPLRFERTHDAAAGALRSAI